MALVVLLLVVGLSAVALVAYAQYRRRQARVGALFASQAVGGASVAPKPPAPAAGA